MAYVILLLLLLGVVWLISGPLRRSATGEAPALADESLESMRRIDLEAARDAKYREIRDAELDHLTGKLSDEDYRAIDSTLRAEAIVLLHELDALDAPDALDALDALDAVDALDDEPRRNSPGGREPGN